MPQNYKIPKPSQYSMGKFSNPYITEIDENEEAFIRLDFSYYKDKLCEIRYFNNKAKSVLEKLKYIGQSKRSTLDEKGIYLKEVKNEGYYKKLFKSNLPQDFMDSMKEHCFGGTCRIFCVFADNVCYIIALTFNHFETNKNRK